MHSSAKRSLRLTVLITGALLSACVSPNESATTYLITSDQPLSVRQLVRTARVIAEYRQLTPAEITQIQRRLSRIFEDMVTAELQAMQRDAEARPELPRPTRRDARARVIQRLGPEFALPLLTLDNRSVVAFGRVTREAVEVTKTAFEIDAPVASLPAGAAIKTAEGQKATLVGQKQ